MYRIADYAVLYLGLCIYMLHNEISWKTVAAALLVVFGTSGMCLLQDRKKRCLILLVLYVSAMMLPMVCYFVPLFVYICLEEKVVPLLCGVLPAEVLFLLHNKPENWILFFGFFVISIHLEQVTKRRIY